MYSNIRQIYAYRCPIFHQERNGFATRFLIPRAFVLGGGGEGGQFQYNWCSYFGTMRSLGTAPKIPYGPVMGT